MGVLSVRVPYATLVLSLTSPSFQRSQTAVLSGLTTLKLGLGLLKHNQPSLFDGPRRQRLELFTQKGGVDINLVMEYRT